jgi:hypothetical protein
MEKMSWTTIEYLHQEKTTDWYWIVGIVTISLALISIILNNLIFAILIIISSFTLSLFASRPPKTIGIELNDEGVVVGETTHPYKELESFWVETRDAVPRILFKSKKILMPFIVIFIEEQNPEELEKFLKKYLKKEEHSEPLLEKILLYLGF